MSNMISTR